MDTKDLLEWESSFQLDGRTFVTDKSIFLDQCYALVMPLPPLGDAERHDKVRGVLSCPARNRFGLPDLTKLDESSFLAPGNIVLSRKYVSFLLKLPLRVQLFFGATGGVLDTVLLFDGKHIIGGMLPIRSHPIHETEDQKLKSDREMLILVPDLTEKAEKGDVESQELLGYIFHENSDVPTYAQQAAKWMTLSAERGNADFQTRLAVFYFCGIGVPKDIAVAETWLLKAAAQDEPEACEKLGLLYGFVQDEPDPVKALILLEKAIGLGRQTAVRFRDKLMQELGSAE